MTIYALLHDQAGDRVSVYDGMSQQTVSAMLTAAGIPFEFITDVQYAAFVITHQAIPLTPTQIITLFRSQAIDLLQIDTSPNSKFIRAVLLTLLDEINLIRSLLPVAQVARTTTQLRNAISAKINAGTAD